MDSQTDVALEVTTKPAKLTCGVADVKYTRGPKGEISCSKMACNSTRCKKK